MKRLEKPTKFGKNPKSAGRTEKIYVAGKVKKGEAALNLNKGGVKGEYNCALEPATGYYDSLEVTKRLDSL